jgi:CheY-like chemotaxis protein
VTTHALASGGAGGSGVEQGLREEGERAARAGGELRQTVLVVEDSWDVGTILATALEDEGYTTSLVRDGQQALQQARSLRPDLITLDLALPGVSGWEVLSQLRADPLTQRIPIVAVSAHARGLDPAVAGQVARVIGKPFYISEVVSAVVETLGRRPS